MRNRIAAKWIIIGAAGVSAVILLLVFGWNLLPAKIRGHLHILTPRLTGTVVLSDGTTEETYRFSARGDYGPYEWTVGSKDLPITVIRFNANNWYVTKMDIRVARQGDAWIITGTVDTDGQEPEHILNSIPVGEPIVISCGGL